MIMKYYYYYIKSYSVEKLVLSLDKKIGVTLAITDIVKYRRCAGKVVRLSVSGFP